MRIEKKTLLNHPVVSIAAGQYLNNGSSPSTLNTLLSLKQIERQRGRRIASRVCSPDCTILWPRF